MKEIVSEIKYDKIVWEKPEYYFSKEDDREDETLNGEIKSLYYRSDYKSEKSYAFAYLGLPKNYKEKKSPGILLIHGALGTA